MISLRYYCFGLSKMDALPDAQENMDKFMRQLHYYTGSQKRSHHCCLSNSEKFLWQSILHNSINMAGWPDLVEIFTAVLLVRNKSTVLQLGLPNSVIQNNQHISGYSHLFVVVHLFDIIYNITYRRILFTSLFFFLSCTLHILNSPYHETLHKCLNACKAIA